MTSKLLSPAEYLASAPKDVRARMLRPEVRLGPGAAAVVGRFFRIVAERGEPIAAPSRASFDCAATSESTLATLIRALARFAPQVCLAGGREARAAWYARRPSAAATPRRKGPAPLPSTAPASWPLAWARLYPGLMAARLEESTRRRYVASVNRCVATLPRTGCRPDWSRYTAYCLLEVWEEEGLRPRTIATYLDGLIALGTHGGLAHPAVDGVRNIRDFALGRAAAMDKLKVARIEDLAERGGFRVIAEAIGRLRTAAGDLPASSAAAERMRRTAAILAVELQAYARTGDVASWVLGRELVRHPCGSWELRWTQGKTNVDVGRGEIWPAIGEVLDELLLAGRPSRYTQLEYERKVGTNWLTHTADPVPARQPSQLVRDVIGVPLHDLRTLLADLMRRVDPETARRLIAAMLGHSSEEAGDDYIALCAGDVGARGWREMRRAIVENPTILASRV